jgi:hypothetical protein
MQLSLCPGYADDLHVYPQVCTHVNHSHGLAADRMHALLYLYSHRRNRAHRQNNYQVRASFISTERVVGKYCSGRLMGMYRFGCSANM